MQGRPHEAILFKNCTGLNDSAQMSDAKYDIEGNTDLIGCMNMTVTDKGKLVKVPALVSKLVMPSAIDNISAGTRMFVQSGTGIGEYNGIATVTPLTVSPVCVPGTKAKFIHTPIDARIGVTAGQYKVAKASSSAVELSLGTHAGPVTSKVFSKMPTFNSGFVFNSKLYSAFGNFLQYSEDYYYDVWNLGDSFIGSKNEVLQSGQVPGCVITVHEDGVTGYFGTGPHDFVKKFFPCSVINGTLFSGFISKVYDSAHVFLCTDGVYVLTADGKLSNLTVTNTHKLNILNTTYNTVIIQDGKYLAYGNTVCVEFDFQLKVLLIRGTLGITASCLWNNKAYYSSGVMLAELGTGDATGAVDCSVKLPYNDLGTDEAKQLRFVYFTGYIGGTAEIVVRNQFGQSVTKDISNLGYVQNYKITGLRECKGNKLSLEVLSHTGIFKIEEIRATFLNCSSRK